MQSVIQSLCMRDNTVGSLSELQSLITNNEAAYIFGLWCADGYYWSSSVGITNVDSRLVDRFAAFLATKLPRERIKLRTYHPMGTKKSALKTPSYPMRLAKQVAYQLYVNSRPLLRLFQKTERELENLPTKYIPAYFAGRFDGDGSVDKNLRNDLRITYSSRAEAEADERLLVRCGDFHSRIYHYRSAKTYILYVGRNRAEQFLKKIEPYSIKVQSLLPRRDSAVEGRQLDG